MLYHFQFEFSDIDRDIYKTLDFRIALHPSETLTYLLTRTLAYALSYQENLEFTPGGLSDPDAPALKAIGAHSNIELWIEIGNPSARRLHKASKQAKQVIVYTYKKPEVLIAEINTNDVHRRDEIKIFSLDQNFLQSLEPQLVKNNRWSILHQQRHLSIDIGGVQFITDIKEFKI